MTPEDAEDRYCPRFRIENNWQIKRAHSEAIIRRGSFQTPATRFGQLNYSLIDRRRRLD